LCEQVEKQPPRGRKAHVMKHVKQLSKNGRVLVQKATTRNPKGKPNNIEEQ
jgi:hypothetical protein